MKTWILCISIIIYLLAPAFGFAETEISFVKKKISVGAKVLNVEIAESPAQLSQGLMHRQKMADDAGMLFIFPEERPLNFWMKNTLIPLSIGFFDNNKKLLEILDMVPVTSIMQIDIPQYKSKRPARYALEVNKGWFAKHGLKPGAPLKLN